MQTRTDAFFLPPSSASYQAPASLESGQAASVPGIAKTEANKANHRSSQYGVNNDKGAVRNQDIESISKRKSLLSQFEEVRTPTPRRLRESKEGGHKAQYLSSGGGNRLTLVNSPLLQPESERNTMFQNGISAPPKLSGEPRERKYSIVGPQRQVQNIAPLIACAEQCLEVRQEFEDLKHVVDFECRSIGELFESAVLNVARQASACDINKKKQQAKVTKLERANALLMTELIKAKESLADAQAERDVLIDELKLCENLGGAPVHVLKARGQELAAMRARAVLANARGREEMRKRGREGNSLGKGSAEPNDLGGESSAERAKREQGGSVESETTGELVEDNGNRRLQGEDGLEDDEEISNSMVETREFFHRCLNSALLSIQIEDNEFTRMLVSLQSEEGRAGFVWALTRHKAPSPEPSKCISDTAFEMIAYLTKECLDMCVKASPKDYSVAKRLLGMEGAFCMQGRAGMGDFIFLQSRISQNDIWKDVSFWEEAFFAALESSRNRLKVHATEFPTLTPKEQKNFIKQENDLVLELLKSFQNRMSLSNVPKQEMNDLLLRLCQIHGIQPKIAIAPTIEAARRPPGRHSESATV